MVWPSLTSVSDAPSLYFLSAAGAFAMSIIAVTSDRAGRSPVFIGLVMVPPGELPGHGLFLIMAVVIRRAGWPGANNGSVGCALREQLASSGYGASAPPHDGPTALSKRKRL